MRVRSRAMRNCTDLDGYRLEFSSEMHINYTIDLCSLAGRTWSRTVVQYVLRTNVV